MARKAPSRLAKRKEAEAAEALETVKGKKATKKKAAKKKATRRTKEKLPQRRRLVWGVYSSSMKEEARFPYDQRSEAEKKIKQLRTKSSKMYFIQPIKEPIADEPVEAKKK